MNQRVKIKWLAKPQDHDYPAALSYLNLIYPGKVAKRFAKALKKAPMVQFKSKDIFRASGLPRLDATNSHVQKDCKIIKAGGSLSPMLLVRDSDHGRVLVADGYHRLCAVYLFDEDAVIPCKII